MNGMEYKVLELEEYGGKLKIKKRLLKEALGPTECLIRVHATTIHPADLFFLAGAYGSIKPKVFPLVPGFEGAGEIVQVGENVDKSAIGKRVCLVANSITEGEFQGLWGEYTYANFETLMIFDNQIDYERIAFSIVNPITVCGFLDTVQKKNVKAIVQTASFSALGKMLIRLCSKEKNIKTINLVRKSEQVSLLKDILANYVINTSDHNWSEELRKISHEIEAKICFECIGGDIGSKILNALPYGSTVYNYGNLLFQPLNGYSSGDLIFFNKKLEGWWLGIWLQEITAEERMKWFGYVISEISSGSDIFNTNISKSFSFENCEEALNFYKQNMSEAKILFKN